MLDAINSAVWIWVMLCVFFLAMEVLAIAGIGFLYAGLASLTVGFLVTFEVVDAHEMMQQIAVFLFTTGLWAAALWIPMKKMLRKDGSGYTNFIGQYAVVYGDALTTRGAGTVKWSGTTMRARIDTAHEHAQQIDPDVSVIITRLEGNVLYVVTPAVYQSMQPAQDAHDNR